MLCCAPEPLLGEMIVDPNFCSKCDKVRDTDASYCSECGSDLVSVDPGDLDNLMSRKRVVVLLFIGGWIYLLYWMYRTWKQYKDHSRQRAFPVWHALTQFVPIYNFFRMHAHFRVYKELILQRGLSSYTPPMYMVVVMIATLVFYFVANGIDTPDVSVNLIIVGVVLLILVIQALIVASFQKHANLYWASFRGASRAPIGTGEVIVTVLGIVDWILTILAVTNVAFGGWPIL